MVVVVVLADKEVMVNLIIKEELVDRVQTIQSVALPHGMLLGVTVVMRITIMTAERG